MPCARPGACICLLAWGLSSGVQAEGWSLAAGMDASLGHYGSGSLTRLVSQYVQLRQESGPYVFKLDLPYLTVAGPSGVRLDADGQLLAGNAAQGRRRVEGVGDAVLGATRLAWESEDGRSWLDVGGRLKLPTASRQAGLGSGKADAALLAELYRQWGALTLFAGAGYKWVGRTADGDYRNVASALVGGSYRFNEIWAAGALVDYRQSVWVSLPDQQELTLYLSYRPERAWAVQTYLYSGANHASPSLGGGVAIRRYF